MECITYALHKVARRIVRMSLSLLQGQVKSTQQQGFWHHEVNTDAIACMHCDDDQLEILYR